MIVESGATLWSWDGNTRTLNNAITINGTGDGNGAIQEQNGTFNLNGPLTLGSNATIHTIGGSSFNIAGNVTGNNNNFTVIQDGGGGTVISGNISLGSGALLLTSNGTVTLTGASNSWSGGTTLACNGWGGSVLNIGNGGAASMGTSGTITIPSGAHTQGGTTGTDYTLLNFNTSSNITLNNYITGGGGIQLASTNTGTITLTGANDYSYNTTINGGALQILNTSGSRLGRQHWRKRSITTRRRNKPGECNYFGRSSNRNSPRRKRKRQQLHFQRPLACHGRQSIRHPVRRRHAHFEHYYQ